MAWQQALAFAGGVRLMAWEGDPDERGNENGRARTGFKEAVHGSIDRIRAEGVSLFVGPEGGFDAEEVEEARDAGVEVVGLGRRILRGETAGLAMAAAVMYEAGGLTFALDPTHPRIKYGAGYELVEGYERDRDILNRRWLW